jgi:hypothetical protein
MFRQTIDNDKLAAAFAAELIEDGIEFIFSWDAQKKNEFVVDNAYANNARLIMEKLSPKSAKEKRTIVVELDLETGTDNDFSNYTWNHIAQWIRERITEEDGDNEPYYIRAVRITNTNKVNA